MRPSFIFYQDITDGQIDLCQYGEDSIHALLKYIYAADLSIPESLTVELGELAKQ